MLALAPRPKGSPLPRSRTLASEELAWAGVLPTLRVGGALESNLHRSSRGCSAGGGDLDRGRRAITGGGAGGGASWGGERDLARRGAFGHAGARPIRASKRPARPRGAKRAGTSTFPRNVFGVVPVELGPLRLDGDDAELDHTSVDAGAAGLNPLRASDGVAAKLPDLRCGGDAAGPWNRRRPHGGSSGAGAHDPTGRGHDSRGHPSRDDASRPGPCGRRGGDPDTGPASGGDSDDRSPRWGGGCGSCCGDGDPAAPGAPARSDSPAGDRARAGDAPRAGHPP